MAAGCAVCGEKLGMGRWLSGKTLCERHEADALEHQRAEQAALGAGWRSWPQVAAVAYVARVSVAVFEARF